VLMNTSVRAQSFLRGDACMSIKRMFTLVRARCECVLASIINLLAVFVSFVGAQEHGT
jgi:hypothetical protein